MACFYIHRSAIEIGNFAYVRQIVEHDFETYTGVFLEKYFREKLALSGQYSEIGCYWERGNQNEIDIVAINDLTRHVLIAEVKRNKHRISLPALMEKAIAISTKFNGYQIEYKALSLEDMY